MRTRSWCNAWPFAIHFTFDVPESKEQGFCTDNAWGFVLDILVPKGTSREIIDKLSVTDPTMFENGQIQCMKKAGEAPMHVTTRDDIIEM